MSDLKKYQLIIFDCDGTLADTEDLNNLALCQVLAEAGFDGYDLSYAYEHWVGKTLTNIFAELEVRTGQSFPEELIRLSIKRTKELYDSELMAVEGALEGVRTVQTAGYASCVASNGERASVLKSLTKGGFVPSCFDEDRVFTRIQVPNGKPAPDLFLFAASQMGVEPADCLVIEDSPTGVIAAVAAGMHVWGFTGAAHDPATQRKLLVEAGAEVVFDRFIHITERLGL